jgi:exonuclease III
MQPLRCHRGRGNRPCRQPADNPRSGRRLPAKLISWNVAGETTRVGEQAAALLAEDPDLVALQELRPGADAQWRAALAAAGLGHIEATDGSGDRRLSAVLTASRWPLQALPPTPMPQPERFLSVRVNHPGTPFELHNAHVPAGMRFGLVKVETMEAIYAALSLDTTTPRILCGDFNSPMIETADGVTRTFSERHPEHRERWHAAELSVIRGLAEFDLPDVFRELHGWARTEHSWVHEPSGRGVRLDHVFASRALHPTSCDYNHDLRTGGLSDHSAIWARFGGR